MKQFLVIILLIVATLLVSCGGPSKITAYTPPSEAMRDPVAAQQLMTEAVEALPENPEKAEMLLRQSLAADLYNGPAHNNLGVLYLEQGKFYEAANEFEWARKLMPGHPDPRLNLGLTLERAGRISEAIEAYAAALEVYPNHLPSLQALTRAQVRHNETSEKTIDYLKKIALRSESEEWRDWAQMQILKAESN